MEVKTEELLQNANNLKQMLEYEKQLFRDIVQDDGLVVLAKGLNCETIITNILQLFANPINLVLVLCCTDLEASYYKKKLQDNVYLTSNCTNPNERLELYNSGGVHIVTTRVLVVDILKQRLPVDKVTGIILLRAHKIIESCQEAFVLRLYRQSNKHGFIKAFTNSAQSFTCGFGHIERAMRTLFVKKLFVWPRFHKQIVEDLRKYEPTVIELYVPLSKTMETIQTCLLELMDLTVKELKRLNKTIELQEITVENCLTKKFHKLLQLQLDSVWHQLSAKSRQLVADLKTLRHLMCTMLYTDPITFYATLNDYRSLEYAKIANWLFFQPADSLFDHANALVYDRTTTRTSKKKKKKNNENDERDQEVKPNGDSRRILNPEHCPKWSTLDDLLQNEIPKDVEVDETTRQTKVLILCQDRKTCFQLKNLLANGQANYLFLMALKKGIRFDAISEDFQGLSAVGDGRLGKIHGVDVQRSGDNIEDDDGGNNKGITQGTEAENSAEKTVGRNSMAGGEQEEVFQSSYVLTISQAVPTSTSCSSSASIPTNDANKSFFFEPCEELENLDVSRLAQSTVTIQTFKCDRHVSLEESLEDLAPDHVIMYHANVTAIREIELYVARSKRSNSVKIYFLIHGDTVEEQSYLTELRREKKAFEYLIETKSMMVVPEDQDGKTETCANLQRGPSIGELAARNGDETRRGDRKDAAANATARRFVIVDMREFRSELPALIHKRGVDIEPVTITVGDYVITNEICIERKTVSDLIGSLNSGRLYNQCTRMCRYYTKPMLLIEFDQTKGFVTWHKNNSYTLSSDNEHAGFHVQQKLVLLTLHFPKLKLIWSPSPYASAQLIDELKADKPEPDVRYAAAIASDEQTTTADGGDIDVIDTRYNANVYDFVRKLPGVTSKNLASFLRNFNDLSAVLSSTQDDLKESLGNSSDAKQLYSAIHDEHADNCSNENKGLRQKRKLNKFKKFDRSNSNKASSSSADTR